MLSKTFVFTKIQKTTQRIEDSLNDFLKDHEFKYATQNESATKGKFIVTLFANKKKSTIRVKVFKDQNIDALDQKVNEFLKERPMKFATQTFVGSNVYTILFYDDKSSTDDNTNSTQGDPSNG
jgi:hypothetical protein